MRNSFCLLLLLVLSEPALAELSFCKGVWTNQSCQNGQEKSLDETARRPQSPEQKKNSLKKSILHEMTMDRVEARRKYAVMVSGQSAETICQDEQSSVDDCEKAASKYSTRLQQSIANALRAKELEEKKEKKEETAEENNSTVVIIRPERRRPVDSDYQYRGPERIVTESGASINISGRSSDGRISGGFSVNNRMTSSNRQIIRAPRGDQIINRTRRNTSKLITAPANEEQAPSAAAPIRKPRARSAASR